MKTVAVLGAALMLAGLVPGVAAQDAYTLPLVPAAGTPGLEGFVRVENRARNASLRNIATTVQIHATDDTGRRFGPVTLSLDAGEVVNLNSRDLERGNASKGLPVGVGDGEGHWRLLFVTGNDVDDDVSPLGFIRTADGFVTTMHRRATGVAHIQFFNPGSNTRQVSRLRLINPGTAAANVEITGFDDRGRRGGRVRLTLPAGAARMVTAQQLEAGGAGLVGRLGDGEGKWRLRVESIDRIEVVNLLTSPTGHLSNMAQLSPNPYFGEIPTGPPVTPPVTPPEPPTGGGSDWCCNDLGGICTCGWVGYAADPEAQCQLIIEEADDPEWRRVASCSSHGSCCGRSDFCACSDIISICENFPPSTPIASCPSAASASDFRGLAEREGMDSFGIREIYNSAVLFERLSRRREAAGLRNMGGGEPARESGTGTPAEQ